MIQVVTTDDLKQTEQTLKDELDSKFQMLLEIIQEGPTMTTNRCAKRMNCTNQTARKRIRNAGVRMNEDVCPMIVETKSFYEALWSGRIKS